MANGENTRNTDIEVLRAVAIADTLIIHLFWGVLPRFGPLGQWFHARFQFWSGVDLFFAISGFVITSSLLKSGAWEGSGGAGQSGRDWRAFIAVAVPFWIRRAFRLLPSAWLWIALTVGFAAFANPYGSFGSLRENLSEAMASVLNLANIYFYEWSAHHSPSYGSLGVYWSLSLEEQFYLLLPCLLFFLHRRKLVLGLATAFLVQFFVRRLSGFEGSGSSLLWFVRTDALILGVLIALWSRQPGYGNSRPGFLRDRRICLSVAGLGVGLLPMLPAMASVAQVGTGLIALVSGALVWLASYDSDCILPPSRLKTAMVWMGSRSYSIYLVHTSARALVLEWKRIHDVAEGGWAAAGWSAGSLLFILMLAEANYRWVEMPFRSLGRRVAGRFRVETRRERTPAPAPAPAE